MAEYTCTIYECSKVDLDYIFKGVAWSLKLFYTHRKMFSRKIRFILCLKLSFCVLVLSHESRNHEHNSFNKLQDALNGDFLTSQDLQRLFNKLHFLNCSDNKTSPDYRRCFTPTELHNFDGFSPSKMLNSSQFEEISPLIVFCLLPAREKNSGQQHCNKYPRNHSELFDSFTRNFSHGERGITHEALDEILEEINKTIGEFLTEKKCFSAESIFEEIEEGEEEGHGHEEEGDNHAGEEKVLDQHDFEKACASIILHLVQGYCIEEGHGHNETKSNLPSKEFFINNLFNGKKHLSEEDLEEIVEILGIGSKSSESSSWSAEHDDHNHRCRRSAGSVLLPLKDSPASHIVHRRAVGSHAHTNGGSCYSLDDMLTVFGIDYSTGADDYDFKQLCPAFIQQAKSGACKQQSNQTKKTNEEKNMGKIWHYGFAAVTIISITSLVGVATILFVRRKMYKKILAMLVALAVGTLSGDSLVHLISHAFGLHEHEESVDGASYDDHSEEKAFIWKALFVLVSTCAFFLFETLMHLCLKSKVGEHGGHSHIDVEETVVAEIQEKPTSPVKRVPITPTAKKPGEVTLTDEQKKAQRMARFGQSPPGTETDKKQARAQRFGLSSPTSNGAAKSSPIVAPKNVDVDKLKKRAERFGAVSPVMTKIEESDKLLKRKQRFGVAVSSSPGDVDAKKQKRAERFGL